MQLAIVSRVLKHSWKVDKPKITNISEFRFLAQLDLSHAPFCILLKLVDWLHSNSLLAMVTKKPTRSVTIKKTGKQADLYLFMIISVLCIRVYGWKFLGTFLELRLLVLWRSSAKKKQLIDGNTFKNEKFQVFLPSNLFTFRSLAQSLLPMANLKESVNQFQQNTRWCMA